MSEHESGREVQLSQREREVLNHLMSGKTQSAIARNMRISPHTVDTYMRRIKLKTGVSNRVQLVLLAAAMIAD